MVCLVSFYKKYTNSHYHVRKHYLVTKNRQYVSIATCLNTVMRVNINNDNFGVYLLYIKLKVIICN